MEEKMTLQKFIDRLNALPDDVKRKECRSFDFSGSKEDLERYLERQGWLDWDEDGEFFSIIF